MDIISRKQALTLGLKRYFTGKPCSKGHISERKTISWNCLQCHNVFEQNKYSENPKITQTRARRWYLDNLVRARLSRKLWRQNNPNIKNALEAYRRACKIKATPLWVNKAHLRQIYVECPRNKVVDHIIPLQGKEVCGLHVPWNLQYLTKKENCEKSNKLLRKYALGLQV